MYEQNLVKVVEPIKKTTITRMNRGKKWKYGYDKEHDIIVISKTGKIGEVIELQGLRIALPLDCLLYTSPSPRDATLSRMPSSA